MKYQITDNGKIKLEKNYVFKGMGQKSLVGGNSAHTSFHLQLLNSPFGHHSDITIITVELSSEAKVLSERMLLYFRVV